ncbi:MAG: hypothetical protein JJ959_18935 [Nisaea sp.]|uniref:hypothetical protein n=1 Tax=Nisaea sp. TaxID=2024842 RepID=UPI001B2C48C3|nr:hypothetical protein [Nisaea sp.]MBO6562630.1 hypothetical protein [Nisaea sp.]
MLGPKSTVLIGAVGSWALLLALSRAVVLGYGLDPWMFTFLQLLSGGVFLLLIARRGETGSSVLLRADTWLIGVFRVGTAALYMASLLHVDVMQASFFGAIGVPASTLAVWILFDRRPAAAELVGHLPLIAGAAIVASGFTDGFLNPAVGLLLVSSCCVLGANLLAERHPHMQALGPGTRIRLTGTVLVITAAGFAAWRFLQASVDWAGPAGGLDPVDLLRPELWIAGLGLGITLRGFCTYLGFRAAAVAGTQNYMAAVLALPIVGALLEAAIAWSGYGAWPALSASEGVGGGLIIFGGLAVVYVRRRQARILRDA